jgi:hypothetical protein
MTPDQYLQNILSREAVDTGIFSPVRNAQTALQPIIAEWAGGQLRSITPSGSFAKGTANLSGTDIDLFISLSNTTNETLKEIYNSLATRMEAKGYVVRRQNVSIGVRVGGYAVDLVPAKHQGTLSEDHSLYRRRADTWTKTNVLTHIGYVRGSGRLSEMRVVKLWRDQKGLDFPSFYLEKTVMNAPSGPVFSGISDNVLQIFQYLRDTFPNARIVDPANSNNIISDDLSMADRLKIKAAAESALRAKNWNEVVL